jgi:hypothetical protein
VAAARLELLEAEKELTRRSDELARRRQELPWVRVDKDYPFETEEGSASLADLFGGRSQLLVYHFMFGPDYKAGCPSCSAIADGFNGFAVHLANHDVMGRHHRTARTFRRARLASDRSSHRRGGVVSDRPGSGTGVMNDGYLSAIALRRDRASAHSLSKFSFCSAWMSISIVNSVPPLLSAKV